MPQPYPPPRHPALFRAVGNAFRDAMALVALAAVGTVVLGYAIYFGG